MQIPTLQQKVLNELIALLKGEMYQFQAVQKQQEEIQHNTYQKHLHKIEYHIEQILQKHNEQIAKINSLKQEANSCRSQRVVYSNLFKKLEKQLKHNQEIYRELLLKAQITQIEKQKQQSVKNEQKHTKKDKNNLNACKIQTIDDFKQLEVVFEKKCSKMNCKQQQNILSFVTAPHEIEGNNLHQMNEKTDLEYSTKAFNSASQDYQQFIKTIKVHTQLSTTQQIIDHFSTIKDQNSTLKEQIQNFNEEIYEMEKQKQQIIRESNAYSIYENDHIKSKKNSNKNKPNSSGRKRNQIRKMQEQLKWMYSELGVSVGDDYLSREKLLQLDVRIDYLFELQHNKCQVEYSDILHHDQNEGVIDTLLQRMQKPSQNEKIMDRSNLQQQYYKQINRKCNTGTHNRSRR